MSETERPVRVCYFGTYRANYARNTIITDGLRHAGVEVVECHEPLWRSFEDREQMASGGWMSFAFISRVVRTYIRLLYRYVRMPKDYDVMVVGYPGQFDIFLARLLTWLNRKPLVWDVLMSIYLICVERGLHKRSPLTAAIIHQAERMACHVPDLLVLDTRTYVAWFCASYGVEASRFRLAPLTADERYFTVELSAQVQRDPQQFHVLYYGTFIPNHGVPYIIEAARSLAGDPSIVFDLAGGGPQLALAQELVERYNLTNVRFLGWLDKEVLSQQIAQADLCLGTFGNTPQSLMTVQNKIYEAMAMARPVVTGDSPAVREVLCDGEHLFLCDRADPQSLADLIVALRNDPARAERVARQGRLRFEEEYSVARVSERFATHLRELTARHERLQRSRLARRRN